MDALGVTAIDHVSILITDLSRARKFYGEVLGLGEIPKPKSFDFVALWFSIGAGQTLHLLQKALPDTVSPRHFALHVPDARRAREHFRRYGITVLETGSICNCDRFFVADPDGNRIELIQWIEPYDPVTSGAAKLD
jgi:catechol 2,3-dioxygenase-like lactoylglutathione lyase family enzyme